MPKKANPEEEPEVDDGEDEKVPEKVSDEAATNAIKQVHIWLSYFGLGGRSCDTLYLGATKLFHINSWLPSMPTSPVTFLATSDLPALLSPTRMVTASHSNKTPWLRV